MGEGGGGEVGGENNDDGKTATVIAAGSVCFPDTQALRRVPSAPVQRACVPFPAAMGACALTCGGDDGSWWIGSLQRYDGE